MILLIFYCELARQPQKSNKTSRFTSQSYFGPTFSKQGKQTDTHMIYFLDIVSIK